MVNDGCNNIDRRNLLTRAVPACAAACLGISRFPGLAGLGATQGTQGQHKFDVPQDLSLSPRQRAEMTSRGMFEFVKTLQEELDEAELIRLLNLCSAKIGRQVGEQQAQNSPDTSFASFVQVFRPPNFANSLTHEIVEDTDKVFRLRVTECLSAEVFRDAGLGGEIGHAAVCNMDYYWPPAFNPAFKMERNRTLMQGHDHCNHCYMNTA